MRFQQNIDRRRFWWQSIALSTLALIASNKGFSQDWPHYLGPTFNSTWDEPKALEKFPEGGPKVLWRQPLASGYSGPSVVGNHLFVMDYVIEQGDPRPAPDVRNVIEGRERIVCLNAHTGKPVWQHEYACSYRISYPAGPRCTPTVDDGLVYTLGAEGQLLCLNAMDGKVVWSHDLKAEYKMTEAPLWGFSAHPLVDGDTLYCLVGGPGSVAVAFDKKTGKEKWRALTAKEPGYCPPIMINVANTQQLIIWSAESINSLNPETGAVYWSFPCAPNYGMSITAPRLEGEYLYACGIGSASILLKLDQDRPDAQVVWEGKGFNTSFSPVLSQDGHLFGVDQGGKLRCINMLTGERRWETTQPVTGPRGANSGSAFIVENGDRYFIAGETGELTIARMSPERYERIDSAKLLEPTHDSFGRPVLWCHPAFAHGRMYWRNDREIICVALRSDEQGVPTPEAPQ